MPVYTYTTLAQVLQQLANRLYDPTMQFWSSAELQVYLTEALRTWNALTAYWRGDFLFNSAPGTTFYDLTDTTAMPATLRPLTVTDAQLYLAMQYHLLEPAVGINPWTGVSTQFTAADLIAAVQRRRDEVLSLCGPTITRRAIGAVAGRIQLPDTVLDVRRMAYLPGAGGAGPSVMWPEDTWGEQSFSARYLQNPAGVPLAYLLSTEPPISFDTDRAPGFAGQYELLTVEAGPALIPATPQTLAIPDDWTHVIKWGALADLLSRESNAKDVLRAGYCEQRYRAGLRMLAAAPALLAMRIANATLQVDAVRSADLYRTGWEAETPAQPTTVLQSGLNMLALASPPDAIYSLTATVVQNAPVPAAPGDPVQVARDDLDAVIDYAQHLAAFKQGGAEFSATASLLQRFLAQAQSYNSKLAELGEFTTTLFGLSQREERANPRMVTSPAEASS